MRKIIGEAGANLNATDKAYNGTPLGWSMYMQAEESETEVKKNNYKAIETYLAKFGKKNIQSKKPRCDLWTKNLQKAICFMKQFSNSKSREIFIKKLKIIMKDAL